MKVYHHSMTTGKINLIRQSVRLAEICGKFSPLNRTRQLVIPQALWAEEKVYRGGRGGGKPFDQTAGQGPGGSQTGRKGPGEARGPVMGTKII